MGTPQGKFRGFIVAGTHSGVGKTTVTLGLLASLKKRGHRVVPFKVGPDYIDPSYHMAATGRISRNLDGWMLSRSYNRSCFERHSREGDFAVVEGVMGLFDGFNGRDPAGSSAQMAKWLGLPIVLVVDAGAMAGSVAALVQGFERFDPELSFAGVIFNNVGSPGHLQHLIEALEGNVDMPCLGGLHRRTGLALPERHLGLVMAHERSLTEPFFDHLTEQVEAELSLDSLLDRLSYMGRTPPVAEHDGSSVSQPVRIAVAQDDAFCFYYQDNLDILTAFGAELVPFSPIEESRLPENIGGIYLGGGYPELYSDRLSENQSMRNAIQSCSRNGMPIYGECGGFMYLCSDLTSAEGQVYPMTGCFPFGTRMRKALSSLGYREIRLAGDTPLGQTGLCARGHEFRYSDLDDSAGAADIERTYQIRTFDGFTEREEGFQRFRTLGSYVHLHFGSCPEAARHLVGCCRTYLTEKSDGG